MRIATPPNLKWHRHSAGAVKLLSRMNWDHRTVRPFESDDVPDEDVQTILTFGAQAPSGFNLQPWRFVVVRGQEQRDRLCEAAWGQPRIAEAPVVVVAFGRRVEWMEHAAEIFGVRDNCGSADLGLVDGQQEAAMAFVRAQPVAVWLTRHVMVAFTYMMLAAEALGWDTAAMEGFDPASVRAVLDLPDDAEVVAMLAIGRQRDGESVQPVRLSLEKTMFAEQFGLPWQDPAQAAML